MKSGKVWAGVSDKEDSTGEPNFGEIARIANNAVSWWPRLKEASIWKIGAGLRPVSPDKLPYLGESEISNLYIAGGSGKDGILQFPFLSKKLSQAITSGEEINKAYSPQRIID